VSEKSAALDPERLSPSVNKHDVPSEARRVDLHASITEVIAEIKETGALAAFGVLAKKSYRKWSST
jgi:hypothetical protein